MEDSPCEKKLLIVLSDASPSDDRCAKDGPFYRNREYTDSVGIADTAGEIRRLRQQGIQVLGVFMGIEKDIPAAREIFGRDFCENPGHRTFCRIRRKSDYKVTAQSLDIPSLLHIQERF